MPWSQSETRVGLALPSPTKLFTKAVTGIIVLIIAGYALLSHAPQFAVDYLALHPHGLLRGTLWQLLTYSLINSGCGLVFNGLVILFLGSAIEREWRTSSFIVLWIVVSIACGLIWSIISLLFGQEFVGIGSDPCVYGLIGAFGVLFRGKRIWFFFWTVEAQHLALLFVGIGLVIGIAAPITWICVAGAGAAYVYIKLRWRMAGHTTRKTPPKPKGFVDV